MIENRVYKLLKLGMALFFLSGIGVCIAVLGKYLESDMLAKVGFCIVAASVSLGVAVVFGGLAYLLLKLIYRNNKRGR
jgi:hypothetical protein